MGYDQQGGPPGRGGLSGRLIGAALIALIGLFMYWNQVQDNPVHGEKQHVSLSPSDEIRLGLESAPRMASEMGGEVPDTDPRAQEVQRMGNYIVTHTIASKSPWKFKFHLLADEKTINAFALPGGQVFITLGLYDKLQTEAQLAGVLSHEMGHVIERHSAQQMAKSQLGNMLIVAVATGSSNDHGSHGVYTPAFIASAVNQMIQLRYSRADESQADLWGVKLMEAVGYDPRAMIAVMQILKSAGGSGSMPQMFQTHPNPDLRIKQIEKVPRKKSASPQFVGREGPAEVIRTGMVNRHIRFLALARARARARIYLFSFLINFKMRGGEKIGHGHGHGQGIKSSLGIATYFMSLT